MNYAVGQTIVAERNTRQEDGSNKVERAEVLIEYVSPTGLKIVVDGGQEFRSETIRSETSGRWLTGELVRWNTNYAWNKKPKYSYTWRCLRPFSTLAELNTAELLKDARWLWRQAESAIDPRAPSHRSGDDEAVDRDAWREEMRALFTILQMVTEVPDAVVDAWVQEAEDNRIAQLYGTVQKWLYANGTPEQLQEAIVRTQPLRDHIAERRRLAAEQSAQQDAENRRAARV